MMNRFFIVDAHMHLGDDWFIFRPKVSFADCLATMENFNIKRAYSSHYFWLSGRFNDACRASIDGYEKSGGAIPFLGVYDPLSVKDSLNAFDNCLAHPGFVGIKLHPGFHGVPADDSRYLPVWKYAREQQLPVMSHTWSIADNPVQKFSVPGLFACYVEDYQDVHFIIGHSGGRGEGQNEAVSLAQKYPNVYLDIAGDIFCLDLIPRMVKSIGAEKLLFGTDWPWFDPKVYLARILLAPIGEREKALILGLNALRIFEPDILKKVEKDVKN